MSMNNQLFVGFLFSPLFSSPQPIESLWHCVCVCVCPSRIDECLIYIRHCALATIKECIFDITTRRCVDITFPRFTGHPHIYKSLVSSAPATWFTATPPTLISHLFSPWLGIRSDVINPFSLQADPVRLVSWWEFLRRRRRQRQRLSRHTFLCFSLNFFFPNRKPQFFPYGIFLPINSQKKERWKKNFVGGKNKLCWHSVYRRQLELQKWKQFPADWNAAAEMKMISYLASIITCTFYGRLQCRLDKLDVPNAHVRDKWKTKRNMNA